VVEYAEFFFASVVENFVGLEFVLLGLLDYAVVFFCAESGLFWNPSWRYALAGALSLNDAPRFFDVKGEILKEVEVTLISER